MVIESYAFDTCSALDESNIDYDDMLRWSKVGFLNKRIHPYHGNTARYMWSYTQEFQ